MTNWIANTHHSGNRHLPFGVIFDAAKKKQELSRTEDQISAPDFWSQPEKSQKVMQDRKRLEEAVADDLRVGALTEDIDTLFELAREGEAVTGEIERELKKFAEVLGGLETGMLLSGENDHRDAIVTIHPGAGGTESQDWAEMLLRMYLRWAERGDFKTLLTDRLEGEGAGIKSATFANPRTDRCVRRHEHNAGLRGW